MTRNGRLLISLIIGLILSIPFQWIQSKGEAVPFTIQIFRENPQHLFFDFSLLALNTAIIYLLWGTLPKYRKSVAEK